MPGPDDEVPEAPAATPPSDEATISGVGSEPVVVLLHSLGLDRSIWDEQVRLLGPCAPSVRCDLLGHGRADPLVNPAAEEAADAVAGLLDTLPWSSFLVTGLSWGGCVALTLAGRRPDLVAGLCLVDTTAWYGEQSREQWAQRAQWARERGMSSVAETQLERWFSAPFIEEHPDVAGSVLDLLRATDLDGYVQTCRAMGEYDARALLSGISVPTTVMVGELDRATPISSAELLADSITGASLRILAGAGHLAALENPAAVAEEIVRLLHRI